MNRHRFTAGLALAVALVLALTGPLAAGESVPFKGTLAGDVTVTPAPPPLGPPFLSADVEAAGNATCLGKFALDIPHIVNPVKGTAVGTYEFIAANGDKVCATFSGIATPTDVPGVLYIVETVTITGGTGRFAGATGSFTTERLYDRIAGTTVGTFSGAIEFGDEDD
jgi:hypothetical protein